MVLLLAESANAWGRGVVIPVAAPVLLGMAAVYLLLPRPRGFASVWGAALAGAALLAAAALLVWGKAATPERFLFYAFAGVAILSGGMLVTQLNPVHAALSFALVVLSTCGLFLLQAAPFLMAATTIIYAGAIVVTFLFVIMLAQQEGLSDADHRSREPLLSTLGAFILLGALLYVLNRTYYTRSLQTVATRIGEAAQVENIEEAKDLLDNDLFFAELQRDAEGIRSAANRTAILGRVREIRASWGDWKRQDDALAVRRAFSNLADQVARARDTEGTLQLSDETDRQISPYSRPVQDPEHPGETVAPLGRMLFTDYLIPVELAGMLLLVATIGAIAITDRKAQRF